MIDQFRELEEAFLRSEVRVSSRQTESLLAGDFFEFGQSGKVWSRAVTIDALAKERPIEREMLDFKVRHLSGDVVLVTYQSISLDTLSGREKHALRSSIWVCKEGRWQMAFHQGTPVSTVS